MLLLALNIAAATLTTTTARADDFAPGRFGADAIFVAPVDKPTIDGSIRASVSVEAVDWNSQIGRITFPVVEAMIGTRLASGQVELDRLRVTALRAAFAFAMPVDVLTVYRDLDRGIDIAGDALSVRVPIRITEKGEILVQPGLELGVRHYVAPVDQTGFNASFLIEARAAAALIENWLSTGIMARLRYDLNTVNMSGFQEEGMGYLALMLDRDHRLYGRIYAGIEHQDTREKLGLPTTNFFTGLGVYGQFGK
jgi:hypothetical protein